MHTAMHGNDSCVPPFAFAAHVAIHTCMALARSLNTAS